MSEILAASTYPLEIVDADQWLQQNKNLPAAQRLDSAKQQSWDASVQALVAFPEVLDILGRDIRWTTDLGNAFLAQQADVMNAIQTLRARAQQSGRLQNTPQQTVSTETQDGQSAIQIAPTDPQMIYPPVYDPYAVWGPPAYGAYPSLWYPPDWGYGGYGSGIGFNSGYFIGGLFSGFLGFGGWGWGLSWLGHALFFNPLFFSHFGFHGYGAGYGGFGYHGGVVAGHPIWGHDPTHRMGVPYANHEVASRFGGHVGGVGISTGARGLGQSGIGRAETARSELGRSAAGGARSEAGGARPEGGGARPEAGGTWRGVGSGGARAPAANQFATRATPERQSFAQGNRAGTGGLNAGGYNRVGPSQGFNAARPGQNFATAARPQEANRSEPNRAQLQARQPQNMARSFAAPSAPRAPSGGGSSHQSAPHASAPHGGGGGGGHSSAGGHSSGGHHK